MTFFYDMNQRLADLAKSKEPLTERAGSRQKIDELSPDLLNRASHAAGQQANDLRGMANTYIRDRYDDDPNWRPEDTPYGPAIKAKVNQQDRFKNAAASASDRDKQKAVSKDIGSQLSPAMQRKLAAAQAQPQPQVEEGSTGDYSAKKARAGKDIGKPGKAFAKIAKGAAERYGSKERGEKVAGAVLAKLRKGVGEAAKPDFLDLDRDGNRTEPMKRAAQQAKKKSKPVDEVKLSDLPVRSVKGRAYGAQDEEPGQDDDLGSDTPKTQGRRKVGAGKGKKIGAKVKGTSKLHRQAAIREELPPGATAADAGEYGHEGDMAKDQIHTIVRNARDLEKILTNQEDLPEWVQSKLAKIEGMMTSVSDYMQSQHERGAEQDTGEEAVELDEKAVSVAQRRAAGIAHAAQKGEIPKSKLRGASKEMAQMSKKELHKFAATKEKGLPAKKKEEVEETTTSGSVATAPAAEAPKKAKGMQYGKGIYDSMNRELEAMIAESMSVNMSSSTEGAPSVTVTATDEDAATLARLLQSAGIGSSLHAGGDEHACPTCGSEPCDCAEQVDENQPDWPTNTETSNDALQYSGGVNKPKTDVAGPGQTVMPTTAVRVQEEEAVAEGEQQELDESKCMECGMYEDACTCSKTDMDESMDRMRELAGIQEAAKPDFLDVDKDGDKKEPMKKALADKKDEKVEESILDMRRLWQQYKA